eukprot:TRINITY_DN92672_c0_g1_i1.p1 TRINITY_DN92672_c0_g1~~TRINITY_DN92672_c0_g1_i1.p1  ORF type:complete len:336 (-),score=64.88 TRINITY_DN92672_c0_g1_i1:34-1041(-)
MTSLALFQLVLTLRGEGVSNHLLAFYGFRGDPVDLMPPAGSLQANRVIVEVGVSGKATYFQDLEEDSSLVIVGCEPDPEKGMTHPQHPRFVLVPAAIGDVPYTAGAPAQRSSFHVTFMQECSSLLQPKRSTSHPSWMRNCTAIRKRITIPVVPLAPVLARAASYGPVVLLDVDAQGSELSIAKSAQQMLSSGLVQRVQLEVYTTAEQDIYVGHPRKEEVEKLMHRLGFTTERCYLSYWEQCIFALPSVAKDVHSSCFDEEWTAKWEEDIAARARPLYPDLPDVSDNWHHMTSSGMERACCSGRPGSQFCWDSYYTPERCCLQHYLQSTGLRLASR